MLQPTADFDLQSAALAERFPLRWGHPHKTAVYDKACPAGSEQIDHRLRVRCWPSCRPLEVRPLPRSAVSAVDGPFTYDDPPEEGRKVWYPNFADAELFGFWDGPLLAQDELQVLEHPDLARVRLWLLSERQSPRTVDRDWQPTPITIEGVPRRCSVDVAPCEARPRGLYGNLFARAPLSDVLAATQRLDPPTITHLVAMSALPGGRGTYASAQLEWILTAAYTAFSAVTASSEGDAVTLHAGFWGCGAFGGNRTLMALLQLLAAGAAGIDRVRFHCFSGSDREHLSEAQDHLDALSRKLDDDPSAWIVAVHRMGFAWGVSDGN